MVSIKSQREIELMRIAGQIVGETHHYLIPFIKEGITTLELDKLAHDFILSKGATPSVLNYNNYPKSICISVNEEVVHGIPSKRKLKNGDIVSLDICACYQGYHGDSAWTYVVGSCSNKAKMLLQETENSLFAGLKEVKPGNKIGDISKAINDYALKYNLGIVKELVGHGIGANLHEDPEIPNYITSNRGITLKEGMVIAIEPMLNLGTSEVALLDDDWTIVTMDGSLSAHFEHTVLVTKDGYEILTKR